MVGSGATVSREKVSRRREQNELGQPAGSGKSCNSQGCLFPGWGFNPSSSGEVKLLYISGLNHVVLLVYI